MREIKFRGKEKATGEWFYGNYFDKDTLGNTQIRTTTRGCLCIDPETVGQFTGLHDRNGVEIYEGDIIKCKSPNDNTEFITSFNVDLINGISWNNNALIQDSVMHFYDLPSDMEVIGNVRDNPELLNCQ